MSLPCSATNDQQLMHTFTMDTYPVAISQQFVGFAPVLLSCGNRYRPIAAVPAAGAVSAPSIAASGTRALL